MPSSRVLQSLFQQALALQEAGRLNEAEAAYLQVLRAEPRDYPSHCMLGRLRIEQGRVEEAEKLLEAAVKIDGRAPPGLAFYGVALLRLRKFEQAASVLKRAIAAAPRDATQRRNYGDALRGLQRFEDALTSYDHGLTLEPRSAEIWACRAETLMALKRPAEALTACDNALILSPNLHNALLTRALALTTLERTEEAIAAFGAVLRFKPGDAFVLGQRAALLAEVKRYDEAIADLDAALRSDPRNVELLLLRGSVSMRRRRFEDAVASYDAAIALDASPDAFFSRALALEELGAFEPAVDSYDRVLALRPDDISALNNRSGVLSLLRRFSESRAGMERVLALEPNHIYAFGGIAHCMAYACDWSRREQVEAQLRDHLLAGDIEVPPGTLLGYVDDPALQLAGARNYVKFNLSERAEYRGPVHAHDRIRIAYLSADFHEHPTARLAAELFERHDRARFEVTAISFGPDDGSAIRARIRAAFEHFYDVRSMNDADIVELLRGLEIDIAVDLKGYTQDARPRVFALRAAPLQVNFLGFPGTLGAEFYDYLLADAVVAPLALQPNIVERIVYLPQCYQPNDSKRDVPACTLTRSEAGLPEQGFVFCSFNNNFKITPAVFDLWMRLLRSVEGSVLWLLQDNPEAAANLRGEAVKRGIDPNRLVFAPRVEPAAHLARHRLADLMLDTLPCSAHTTGSDALWMGLPMVTCPGQTFAGRVGASLCHAVGLQELVARDLAEYESIALQLARDSQRLATIKAHLESGRSSHALFDAAAHCKGVEAAFETMWERYRRGLAPEPFAVASA